MVVSTNCQAADTFNKVYAPKSSDFGTKQLLLGALAGSFNVTSKYSCSSRVADVLDKVAKSDCGD